MDCDYCECRIESIKQYFDSYDEEFWLCAKCYDLIYNDKTGELETELVNRYAYREHMRTAGMPSFGDE